MLIPTYNRANYLRETLLSVLAQTRWVNEVIVVDDGSTDNTREVLETMMSEHGDWAGRVKIFIQENRGQAAATNFAIEKATSDWVGFNDSDDLWEPQKLEEQFRALEQYPECQACFSDAAYVGHGTDDSRTAIQVGGDFLTERSGRLASAPRIMTKVFHGIYVQTLLIRNSTLKSMDGFDSRFIVGLDVDFLLRLALRAPLCYVNKPLVRIDRTPVRKIGITLTKPMLNLSVQQTFEVMFSKWLTLPDMASHAQIRRIVKKKLGNTRSTMANLFLLRGEPQKAKTILRGALADGVRLNLLLKFVAIHCLPVRWVTAYLRWRWGSGLGNTNRSL
ncbi:MAG: glycosyltransferase family A protein [Nibricoccus sp.]